MKRISHCVNLARNVISLRRRLIALCLCLELLLTLSPVCVNAVSGYTVTFVDYDLSELEEDVSFTSVPQGARLYTQEELSQEMVSFSPVSGCSWYLYYPGGGGIPAYGPQAIPDPPEREGYTFRDWVCQGASGDSVYTVTDDTVFVARYSSQSQYLLSLYYQFANDGNTVAAETTTVPYSLADTISIELPTLDSLAGLTPQIIANTSDPAIQAAVAALNQMFESAGTFSGTLDETFLQNCRTAGFVVWDEETKSFQKDENGNIPIQIPVTYTLTGKVEFTVQYYWQDAESPEQYTLQDQILSHVEGTTRVSLMELGLVKTYPGFALTSASVEDAESYTVNANGTSTIKLYYDRNVHYLYYQMNGGNSLDPVPLRFGQSIPETIGSEHTRPGYEFDSWLWYGEDGNALEEMPTTMPDQDLTLAAQWVGANTTVTLVYWLENANDNGYTVAGQRQISVTSGQRVGYEAENGVSSVDVSINQYLSAQAMEEAGITDGEFFTFSAADSSTQWEIGVDGGPKIASGDGSTVINLGYTRNSYTLVFHLGRFVPAQSWWQNDSYQVSIGGNSDNGNDLSQWQNGFSWMSVLSVPTLTMGGTSYTIDENDLCYEITAKYGAYISDLWPVATDQTVTKAGIYLLYTWGTHSASTYYANHDNKNIIGIYPTMSEELILDSQNPNAAHHLVGYWNVLEQTKTHHFLFEAVPGTEENPSVPFSRYSGLSSINAVGPGGLDTVQELNFYEDDYTQVRTTAGSELQNPPAFANLTFQYGCYQGDDVYFFYTYNDYTVTYHENNADLTNNTPESQKTVTFHYLENKTLAEELGDFQYNYVPESPFISAYGNAYTFAGWYTDADLTFPVNWESENPASSINLYAKWTAPSFTLTLIVPEGGLYQESLEQFAARGYTCTVFTQTDSDGQVTTTYTVSGIPGGTKASEIVSRRYGAHSFHSLAFDYWGYWINGAEQRYLFDESQLITGDLTLTARWKTEYTGQYTVRYLTQDVQDNGLPTEYIDGVTYYRLMEDKHVTGVAIGSSVTEEARPADGYLSQAGELTKIVETSSSLAETTYFDFFYTKITASVTYYVHYVRDTGEDYGRSTPPADVILLAQDKTVTVDAASLKDSTTISETALVIGGYTPRDSWNVTFTLSAEESQNHLYVYYVSNTLTVSFQAIYHIQGPNGSYQEQDGGTTFLLRSEEALGKALSGSELAVNYSQYLENTQELDTLLEGHVLDEELTTPFLLISLREEDNVLHIYLKNGSFTIQYHLNDDAAFPASWGAHDSFLTADASGNSYFQQVTYPNGATVPTSTPSRLAYDFVGWNTEADGSGDSYSSQTLAHAPWYQPEGLVSDIHLYAQWGNQLSVTFSLRGGTWTDTSGQFYNTGSDTDPKWVTYLASGNACPQPSDPAYVLSDGTAYSFIGWTDVNPEQWEFVDEESRVNLEQFAQYRFTFTQSISEDTVLYAVWDPDVTTFDIRKTDTKAVPLSQADFTLERLKATVTGNPDTGYVYQLETDTTGSYLPDDTFSVQMQTSGQDGTLAFVNLPAGYYRLTETKAPDGYQGSSQPVILYAPYGGTPEIYEPLDHPLIDGQTDNGDLIITVQNIPQYHITITAPDSLTLTYSPPDFIWNPETLQYEGKDSASGQWQVAAPDNSTTDITVTNDSLSGSVQVEVALQYTQEFQDLLPLSILTGPDGFVESGDALRRRLQGILPQNFAATFSLTMEGNYPAGLSLPTNETEAGSITVHITPATG